jgi:dTMP kinase
LPVVAQMWQETENLEPGTENQPEMKFAVIEGIDGSGKSTQIRMLQEYLTEKNIPYKYLHFPRTDSPVFGDLIARFLRGEFGTNDMVDPYLVALIYAGDRKDATLSISQWLKEKKLVIADRYVFSNIAYQCAKIKDESKRNKLKDWIINFEYNYNNIPKPDVNIFLDVPFQFTVEKLSKNRAGNDRSYLKGVADIHEENIDFQRKVRDMYVNLARNEKSLQMIRCSENDKMMDPEKIFKLLLQCLSENGIL